MKEDQISLEEIKTALSNSGYFLETRALSILHQRKYTNTPNSTYPDKITGKSRELDIYSESARITDNIRLNHFLHFEFQHKLVIECSNNSQPVVFFKRPDHNTYTIFSKFKFSKVEREIETIGDSIPPGYLFDEFTTSSKHFHYNQLSINTQYCSFLQKKTKEKDWMASHPDGLNDTYNKLFDFVSHKTERFNGWMPKSPWRNDVFIIFLFPVIILQNQLFEAHEVGGQIELEEKKHIIFEFSRFTDTPESLLIDIITEDYLNTYIDLVTNDLKSIKKAYLKLYKGKRIKEAQG